MATVAAAIMGPRQAAGWSLWVADSPMAASGDPVSHLVVSEVMVGGSSASDEFVEIYNPSAVGLPLEGLELVYVSASGATVTRKAAWEPGAATVAPGAHVLVANEAGTYASDADVTYANGLAATGGSVAIRIVGAGAAIDAVGWGTATSAWLEGQPAAAVGAGHSLERLPGGAAGSGQDTDQNQADFIDRPDPDPQNAAAPPVGVSPSPSPSAVETLTPSSSPGSPDPSAQATATPQPVTPTLTPTISASPSSTPSPPPTPSPTPTSSPTPTPTPMVISVAEARALPDGSVATIEAISLTHGTFTDGGGCVADVTGGIAVLVSGGTFPRGSAVLVKGELDDRYYQRTLRAEPSDVSIIGPAVEPEPITAATGAIGESMECRLVSAAGAIVSAATQLSGAVAYDIDDGSGPVRLIVPDGSGVDVTGWTRGTTLGVRAVVGQRDSGGTGAAGYRLQLRAAEDVVSLQQPTPSPSATSSATASPSAGPGEDPSVVTIAGAREAAVNTRLRVRGVVTLPTSVLGDGTAAIQDASGAIVLRLGDEAGQLSIGDRVQVEGVRSTKSGMETLRVSTAPIRLGDGWRTEPALHATGSLGEEQEANLVTVRGSVATTPRRTSAQNVYFDVDDGTGPLRVYLTPGSGLDGSGLQIGSVVEIVGVLGQETTGQQPLRGYRLWPRRPADVSLLAEAAGEPVAGASPAVSTGGTTVSGPGAGGSAGAGDGDVSDPPRWPDELPVPDLAAARGAPAPTREASAAPDPRPTGARGHAQQPLTLMLLLIGGLLAAATAVAALRPGMVDRLWQALAGLARAGDASDQAAAAARAEPDPALVAAAAVTRPVPLPVADDSSVAERASSVASR